MAKPRKGRPVTVGRSAVVSLRMSPEIRTKLKAAADAGGTTLTEELETRLSRSFEGEAPTQDRAALRVLAEIMRRLDAATGRRWCDDPWLFAQFEQAVAHLLQQWRPAGDRTKAAVSRFSPEDTDRLGFYVVQNVLMQLAFSDAPGDPFARLYADLGDLANRSGT
jgi:hypothetical protein